MKKKLLLTATAAALALAAIGATTATAGLHDICGPHSHLYHHHCT